MDRISYVPMTVRKAGPDDKGFIYNSWLRSYRDHSHFASLIPKSIYYKNQAVIIERLLEESGVAIACNPEDTDQIFGYCCYQPSTINVAIYHYIYVKHPYRKLGIATSLKEHVKYQCSHDEDLPLVATHETDSFRATFQDKWNMIFNPYVLGVESDEY